MRIKLVIYAFSFLMAFNSVAAVLTPSEHETRIEQVADKIAALESKKNWGLSDYAEYAELLTQWLFLDGSWSAKMTPVLLSSTVDEFESSGDGGAARAQRREGEDNQTQQQQQQPGSPLPLPALQQHPILVVVLDLDETLIDNRGWRGRS